MKKFFLFSTSLFLLNLLFSQTFVSENKLWSTLNDYSYWNSGGLHPPSSSYTKFEQDTIIGSFTYKKVFTTNDFSMIYWDHVGYIREDVSQKVYLRDLLGNEGLIYDFMANVGDTISFYNPLNTFTSIAVVDSIYQINLEGNNYTAIEVRDTSHMIPEIWTKEMGNLLGVLKGGFGLSGTIGWGYRLLCYYENDSLIYHDHLFPSCYYNTPFFAPVGAKWHYTEQFAFSGDVDYIRFQVEKDTIVQGINCKKITKRHKIGCNDRSGVEFMYLDSLEVYFWDDHFNKFQMLYDFDANPGDFWFIELKNYMDSAIVDSARIYVDSVTYIGVNNYSLKKLYVKYAHSFDQYSMPYESVIVEGIGDMTYMFNYSTAFQMACDDNFSAGLRCYQDDMIGLYETGIASDCEYYNHVYVDQIENENLIKIFPNPASDYITIEKSVKTSNDPIHSIELFSMHGQVVHLKEYVKNTHETINISELKPGMYILKVITSQNTFSEIITVK